MTRRSRYACSHGHIVLDFLRNARAPELVLHHSKSIMFRVALRPAAVAARSFKPANATRSLAVSAVRRAADHHDHADHHAIPTLLPPGSKPGEVPSDLSHATGLERLQVLGEAEGVKVFDYEPLDASRVGTIADPIKVFSWVSYHIAFAHVVF